MNKKGVSVLLMLFEILGAVLVVYIMTSIATSFGESETVFKINLAKDITLRINTLISAPEDALVYYPEQRASEYIILIENNSALVYEEETDSPAERARRHFVSYKDFGIKQKINPKNRTDLKENERWIHFKKIGNTISMGVGAIDFEEGKIVPPTIEVYTKDQDWPDKKIIISPESIEGELNELGRAVSVRLNSLSGKETSELKDLVKIDSADMVIELKTTEDKQNTVTAYVPSDSEFLKQNKKLSALIISSLIDQDTDGVIKTSDVVISDEYFPIKKSDVAVVIEISKDVKEGSGRQITITIPEAIKEYYT
jgi:hypothetical protein